MERKVYIVAMSSTSYGIKRSFREEKQAYCSD